MRTSATFLAGVMVGGLMGLSAAAHAGWNEQPAYGPDRALLEKLVAATEESGRRLKDIADAQREQTRATTELTRATQDVARQQGETARAVEHSAQRCR
ncbi:MAG: hypothetical protein AB2A00_19875 [Myxococcota bacterium]